MHAAPALLQTIYFSQLPDSWQGDDDKCFKALDVGYKLGQASPGTNSIMEVIKSTVDGKAGELDKTILDKIEPKMLKWVMW